MATVYAFGKSKAFPLAIQFIPKVFGCVEMHYNDGRKTHKFNTPCRQGAGFVTKRTVMLKQSSKFHWRKSVMLQHTVQRHPISRFASNREESHVTYRGVLGSSWTYSIIQMKFIIGKSSVRCNSFPQKQTTVHLIHTHTHTHENLWPFFCWMKKKKTLFQLWPSAGHFKGQCNTAKAGIP